MRPLPVAGVAATAFALGTLGAVASSETGAGAPARRVVQAAPAPAFDGLVAGAPLQRATCRHWHAAPPSERQGVVSALRGIMGGPSSTGGVGATLTDTQAFALFDRQCATPDTSGFVLYLMYARAAAFGRSAAGAAQPTGDPGV